LQRFELFPGDLAAVSDMRDELLRMIERDGEPPGSPPDPLAWQALPRAAQLYVAAIIATGTVAFAAFLPVTNPRPALFAFLLIAACVTSAWKVTLPIALASGSTLSVSYAANLMALILLGPRAAVCVAVAGAWTQCTFNVQRSYPAYRTAFSVAAEAITMAATGLAYGWLGGPSGSFAVSALPKPLVGAIATYFVVNTGLVAGAIALSTGRSPWRVWHDDFFWSGSSFMVAGSAGALAAVIIERGEHWMAVLMIAPIYLTYRTYEVFVGRLDDEKRFLVETRRLHQEEQTARASAEEANRLKDQFLAMVSHELRTPLNAILGWADMLRSGRLEPSKRDRACRAVYDSARRQAQLIDELLDVSRIMSGKLRLEPEAVDLEEVLRAAIDVMQPAAEAKEIHIALDASALSGAVYGDPARLQQVVWNLLSNAVKFTPDRGTIHVRLRQAGHTVEIAVTDSGEGIPPGFLPSVFEPFRQADGSTTRSHAGLGLGLAIVKHLVQAHRGTVRAESGGKGRGATFTVRLPMIAACARPRTVMADLSSVNAAGMSLEGLSVLFVDDDEENRRVVTAQLESRGAVVLTAASAAEAFDVLQREHVDVLLADVAMPDEDGYSLIRKLRACPGASAMIPAAAVTAFAREEDRQQAFRAGFQLHLAKPIDAGLLVEAVASLGHGSSVGSGFSRTAVAAPVA
jgi:signal transduction histidine kinase/CheY-like chemotaxis protein